MESIDPYINFLAIVVIIVLPLSILSTIFSWYLAFLYRKEKVGLALILAIVNTLALMPATYFAVVAYWTLNRMHQPDWGTTVFATGIALSDFIPLITAGYLAYRRIRSGRNE